MKHVVYIIECTNGSYYTGYTTDVERRFQEHQQGIRCKYTRAFGAEKIVSFWTFETRSDAMCAEYHIKRLTKKEKQELLFRHAHRFMRV
ncbi:MAG: hypothetical protein A3C44_04475 [Gammaproteobacteria bacterium RIFCSPHIGHO2_02_FULL_39_13]|nr:MAG: hypothetical protein A3C44_04475 [Gammaproteobacteria bacterium RIFCSPHIGHO2_02_FULL_39_13]